MTRQNSEEFGRRAFPAMYHAAMPKGDREFGTHLQTRTVSPPRVLYKYTTVCTARTILATGRLRFQSPQRYNDPFDCQWNFAWPLLTSEAQEYQRALLAQALREPRSWPPDADPQLRAAMAQERDRIKALPEEQREAAIAAFLCDVVTESQPGVHASRELRDLVRRMRVLCLSEDRSSLLMWSHYANQHQGVVLGFDASVLEDAFRRPVEKVQYTAELPRLIDHEAWIRSAVFGVPQSQIHESRSEWYLAKCCDWKYEREWRFGWIASRGSPGDYEDIPFPSKALVEFVSGCRTDPTQAKNLLSLADGLNPRVRQCRLSMHPTRFELVKS